MQTSTQIRQEFEQLTQRGWEILNACGWNGKTYAAFKPGGLEALKYRSQVLGLLRRIFGEKSKQYQSLRPYAEATNAAEQGYYIREFVEALQHAHAEFQRQQIFDTPPELLSQMSRDVIELAEMLMNADCYLPAAERAGERLCTTLRHIAYTRGLSRFEEMQPHELNTALFEQGAYDRRSCQRIGAFLQIWRDAGCEKTVRIHRNDVAEMVQWVQQFAAQHRL